MSRTSNRRLAGALGFAAALTLAGACSSGGSTGAGGGTCCACECAESSPGFSCTNTSTVESNAPLDCASACADSCSQAGCPTVTSAKPCESGSGGGSGGGGGGGSSGSSGSGGTGGSGGFPVTKSDKLDLLLMVDNSAQMGDKQKPMAATVGDLVRRLANPLCVDADGLPATAQPSDPAAACEPGSHREASPVTDLHVGVITSSLGGHGADHCSPAMSPYDPMMEDMAHLVSRTLDEYGNLGQPVPTWDGKGFLAWDPNAKLSPPGESSLDQLVQDLQAIVTGAGQHGCGFESQLESAYRFLVDPDPYQTIDLTAQQTSARTGTDQDLLAQRAAFLRPDSAVLVVSLSDENDCSLDDSLSQAYFAFKIGAGGNSQFHLPRATSACAADPNDECCRSCAQPDPAGCTPASADTECQKGEYTDEDDPSNLRCWDQKRRFGIDFLAPVARYADGFTSAKVPDRSGSPVDNPLLAGGRSPYLVVNAAIVGVPWQDVAEDPADLGAGFMTPAELAAKGRWDVVLGDPDQRVLPTDPLMIESLAPRSGTNPITSDALAPPTATSPSENPINGHEFDAADHAELQYSCIFALDAPRVCSGGGGPDCECYGSGPQQTNPVCQDPAGGGYGVTQFAAAATPPLRQLEFVEALGDRGLALSLCGGDAGNAAVVDALLAAVRSRMGA